MLSVLALLSTLVAIDIGGRAGAAVTRWVSVGSVSVLEGDAGPSRTVSFAVTLSVPATTTVKVGYAIYPDGTSTAATGPSDFSLDSGFVTFTPTAATGQTPTTTWITTTVQPDTTAEADETYQIVLSDPTGGYALGASVATATILNDDPGSGSRVGITDATIWEGNEGDGNTAKVDVSLTGPASEPITVTVTPVAGTASAVDDYQPWSAKTLTFQPGQTEKAVSLSVVPDLANEGNETVRLVLGNLTGPATIFRKTGVVTIRNDDPGPPTSAGPTSRAVPAEALTNRTVSVGGASVLEGDAGTSRTVTFPVTLSEPSTVAVAVGYAIYPDGTRSAASGPTDFPLKSGRVTFTPSATTGQTPTTTWVTTSAQPDTTAEADETYQIVLSDPTAGYVLGGSTSTVTIINDDPGTGSRLGITDTTIWEGNRGDANVAKLDVSLSKPATTPITVTVTLVPGTAAATSDYQTWSAKTLTFDAGQTEQTVSVAVSPDSSVEADETVQLLLSDVTGPATLMRARGTVIIRNDDAAAATCTGVQVAPGTDIQAAIDANPEGTRFCLAPGEYRGQQLHPKSYDEIVGAGQGLTVLNGSNLIPAPVRSGTYWYAPNQTQRWPSGGTCLSNPVCSNAELLYIDDRPLTGVASLAQVVPGTFFFDYAADRVYFADDPTGHKVEVGALNKAIVGDRPAPGRAGGAVGVTVRDLTVEKYAQGSQQAPIETNDRWLVQRVTTQLNGGVGIKLLGAGPTLSRSRVLRNGQVGVGANGGDGINAYGHAKNAVFVDNTEIAYNNVNGYDPGWEAGGTKFWQTKGSVIANNWSHHNQGPGLWDDGFNEDITYVANLLEDNTQNGIFHEIGGKATIVNNVFRRNGGTGLDERVPIQTCRTAICISSGKNVEIAFNGIIDNGRGIVLTDDPHAPDPTYGINIHDNTFYKPGDQAIAISVPAYEATGGRLTDYLVDRNQYTSGTKFGFDRAVRTWTDWRGAGFDPNGGLAATGTWSSPVGIQPG